MLGVTLYQPGESQYGRTGGLRNQTERHDFEALELAYQELDEITEYANLLGIQVGCIILQLMLNDPAGVDYYSDPANRESYAKRIKDILRAKHLENSLPVDDIDDMVITFSDEDIKEARHFFDLGK